MRTNIYFLVGLFLIISSGLYAGLGTISILRIHRAYICMQNIKKSIAHDVNQSFIYMLGTLDLITPHNKQQLSDLFRVIKEDLNRSALGGRI